MRPAKILLILFVILTVFSWFFPIGWLWGLLSWRSVWVNAGLVFAIVALLSTNRSFQDLMSRMASWSTKRRWFEIVAFTLVMLVFYLLRWRHDLWGELCRKSLDDFCVRGHGHDQVRAAAVGDEGRLGAGP